MIADAVMNLFSLCLCLPTLGDDGIDPKLVHDEIKIGKFILPYMTKDFEETSELKNTPENILPMAEILKIANPSLYTRRIIDVALGMHHDLEFERVVMLNPGGENCQFAVSSSLYPNPGGSSGIPWTYRSWVRGDGKKIEPQIYLWNCWSIDSRSDINLRCHIALKDLTPAKGKAKLVGDQIQKIAAEGLDSILTKPSGSDQPLPQFGSDHCGH